MMLASIGHNELDIKLTSSDAVLTRQVGGPLGIMARSERACFQE